MTRFLALLLLLSLPAHAREAGRTVTGTCTARDGDTIVCAGVPIRLSGLHAPELSDPGGKLARAWMADAIAGQTITCRLDGTRTRDRWAGVCRNVDGDLAAQIIAAGLARDCPRFSGGRYRHLEKPEAARFGMPGYCVRR